MRVDKVIVASNKFSTGAHVPIIGAIFLCRGQSDALRFTVLVSAKHDVLSLPPLGPSFDRAVGAPNGHKILYLQFDVGGPVIDRVKGRGYGIGSQGHLQPVVINGTDDNGITW